MGEIVQFNQLTTSLKSMESINSDERYFEGLLTVQMKDKQGEVTIVDELYKVLPIWMDRGAPISDTHSNRIIGKGINYSKTVVKNVDGDELAAIKITGKIFKNYELDNVIWDKIKNNEYKGLSFGGATRSNRTPMKMKDGSMAYALSNLEHYEVAVCKDPAVPMAVITDYNPIAKSTFNTEMRDDGKMVIRCTQMGCFVEKADESKPLNKPMRDDGDKKFKVYVKDPKTGNVITVRFGDPNMEIKRDSPERRSSFRARHKCSEQKDVTSAAYWSCKMWEKSSSVSDNISKSNWEVWLEKADDIDKANLNESQTFEQKVEALVREGKSRESAEKIVGSFVHKDSLVKIEDEDDKNTKVEVLDEWKNDDNDSGEEDDKKKAGYQTEDGNEQLGGQSATIDKPKKRKEEDDEKDDDEVQGRDHSDSDGDLTSTYNQNVGRDASSGRKLKGDTTVNQVGGIRGGNDTSLQGSGESNDINIVQKPERKEEKGAPNIKVVKTERVGDMNSPAYEGAYNEGSDDVRENIKHGAPKLTTDLARKVLGAKKIKAILYSLEKHAQIQQLKKIKGSLPDKKRDFSESSQSTRHGQQMESVSHQMKDEKPQTMGVKPSGKHSNMGNKQALEQLSSGLGRGNHPMAGKVDPKKELPKTGTRPTGTRPNTFKKALERIRKDLGDARGCTELHHH